MGKEQDTDSRRPLTDDEQKILNRRLAIHKLDLRKAVYAIDEYEKNLAEGIELEAELKKRQTKKHLLATRKEEEDLHALIAEINDKLENGMPKHLDALQQKEEGDAHE